jgi:two-component system sensor histidine kinase KdpD
MFLFDRHIDLGNQALILVLGAAVAALWLPRMISMALCAIAVLAFNYAFVPPRGTFAVGLEQHVLLLVTMLAVSWLIAFMVEQQRRLAETERVHRARAEQLRGLGEALRDADNPLALGPVLQAALAEISGSPATLLLLAEAPSDTLDAGTVAILGEASADERVALWLCMRQPAMTGGTGAPDEQLKWYLPIRGRNANFGAALIHFPSSPLDPSASRQHAQALCDQMGLAIERAGALRAALAAREAAQAQALRNTLLAAISHDHRTPLATILGAGSSLLQQSDRLSPEQRTRLAATIVDEARQLARLTDNTLQLARLDAQAGLRSDWESVEELVGTVVRRMRQRDAARQIRIAVEPGLPLLRCDAVLLVQLLDNLLDNAFKHGGGDVELQASRRGDRVVLSVQDRGPGVPEAWRTRIFDAFQRAPVSPAGAPGPRGAGLGLAVCRAIARAHGGDLTLLDRPGGGACFELALPIEPVPRDRANNDAEVRS